MKYVRRILIVLVVVIYNEFFNLSEIKDIYIGPITLWDVISLLVVSYLFLELMVNKTTYKGMENRKAIVWINWLIFFIFIIALSMPLRGETLGNALMMSRKVILPYIMIHLFVIDIQRSKSTQFLEKVLVYNALVFSMVFVGIYIIPNLFVNQLGFAYVVAAFILLYWKNYYNKAHKTTLIALLILFVGVFAQPFRAYAFSSVGLIMGFTLLRGKVKKMIKYFAILMILLAISFPLSNSFGEYSMSKQVDTLISDLTEGGEKSSTGARLVLDLIYRIPMIEKSPYFGYGFVHPKGEYAKQLGFHLDNARGIDAYNLFFVDSGYLTFLTTYGFMGTLLILLIYFKISLIVYKSKTSLVYKYSFFTLLLSYIASTYTHHPLMMDFGIVPLMMILSLTTIKERKFNQ